MAILGLIKVGILGMMRDDDGDTSPTSIMIGGLLHFLDPVWIVQLTRTYTMIEILWPSMFDSELIEG